MKKSILITAIILCSVITANAQITLENTYPSNTRSLGQFFQTVKLAVSGTKYVAINTDSSKITLYNLDHTLFKTINISVTNSNDAVAYISEHLFDTDDGIEYLIGSFDLDFLTVYNEDGSVVWTESDCSQKCFIGWQVIGSVQPIVNTDSGTKMIVHIESSGVSGPIKVYGLPGTLLTGKKGLEGNGDEIPEQFKIYPNPSQDYSYIDYELPKGNDKGEIVIYDITGK